MESGRLAAGGIKASCNAGDLGSIPGLGRSPGESHGQRSLEDFNPWGRKVGHN